MGHSATEAGLILSVDLGALAANWEYLASLAKPAECAAVVKADAYGLGIEAAVPTLFAAGCRTFFVALPSEGRRVREAAPDTTIYMLGGFFADWAESFRTHALRPVLNSFAMVEAWSRRFPGNPSAIQVDTGMNRLGLSLHEALELARRPELLKQAAPALLMSHLVISEEPDHPLNRNQLALFREIRAELPALPASLANSAAIHLGADYRFDMVRPGIALYGGEFSRHSPPLRTVVTASARILQIRSAIAGETVGYAATKRLAEETRIAIVAAGYADGYHRLAGSSDERPGAFAYLRGRRAPLLGRVSMDLIAINVNGIEGVTEGDFVELFGPNLPVDEVARSAGTVGYELLTQLSHRAERVYVS